MKKLKLCNIETSSEDDEKHKKFIVLVRQKKNELEPKVKYKELLKEETDFLD